MRKYPIGIQDFGEIRRGDYVYVDKTSYIHTLVTSGKFYFLSRPRRFGKSLMLSTIKELFCGSKELFKGLWIEDKWDWEKKFPIIHLKLSQINYQQSGLYNALSMEVDMISEELGVVLEANELKDKFRELIKKASKEHQVVILIDEYDKPIIDYLSDLKKAEENQAVFKEFYSVLKDSDPYIRLLLITGVSKFSKVSIFSDLNNLDDITLLRKHYSAIIGITQQELELTFVNEITTQKEVRSDILDEIRKWYNGYSWDGDLTVYNPFSVLKYMASNVFQNYWFETGTPTFLIEQIRKHDRYDFENLKVDGSELGSFRLENLLPTTLLFQTGYLTIKNYREDTQIFTLGYPNREVKASLVNNLLSSYREIYPKSSMPHVTDLIDAVELNDISKVIAIINVLFADIPTPLWKGATEVHYHALIHLAFTLLGTYIESEPYSALGRADAVVKTSSHIYLLEFKLDKNPSFALEQIRKKDYLGRYALDSRKKLAIGINISSVTKKVESYNMLQAYPDDYDTGDI